MSTKPFKEMTSAEQDASIVERWRSFEAQANELPEFEVHLHVRKIEFMNFLICTKYAMMSIEFVRLYEERRSRWLWVAGVLVLTLFSLLLCGNDSVSTGVKAGLIPFMVITGHGWSHLAVSIQRWIDRSRK